MAPTVIEVDMTVEVITVWIGRVVINSRTNIDRMDTDVVTSWCLKCFLLPSIHSERSHLLSDV